MADLPGRLELQSMARIADRPPQRERLHRMPFGAEPTPEGAVRFRLWAPAARRIELVLLGALEQSGARHEPQS
ncbi:MAG TPA: hypothetical protein VGI35_03110, partial [Steroidobacteraceae bacterium]